MVTLTAKPAFLFGERASRADRALRLCSLAVAVWLVGTVSPVVHFARDTRSVVPVVVHLAALGLVCLVLVRDERVPRVIRDWLPLGSLPFVYLEARWPIAGLERAHADATVRSWEAALFPGDPSRSLATHFHSVALSEVLHAAYLSYYGLIYLPPAVLYVRGRRQEFAETILALTIAFGVCFAVFLVFPVDGPRFVSGPALAPDGPIRTLALALLQGGSTRGTAFPSSHVAASVAATICALRFTRPLGYLLVPITAALAVATVYAGFHYAVDVAAGLAVGVSSIIVASFLWRRLLVSR